MEFNINSYFSTNVKLQIKFINESDFTRTEKMYYLLGYKANLIALKNIQEENFDNIFKTIDDEMYYLLGYKASLIALKNIQEDFDNIFKTIDDEINKIIGEIVRYGE